MKGFIVVFLGLFSSIALLNSLAPKEKEKRAAPMERVKVRLGPFHVTEKASGFFQATQHFKIQSPVIGEVEHLLADVGDRVVKGQTLAWISDEQQTKLLKDPTQLTKEQLIELNRNHPNIALISPFDGVVLTRPSFSGKTVDPKTPIFTLAKELRVAVSMTEPKFNTIKKSKTAWIHADSFPDLRFNGEIVDVRRSEATPELIDVFLRIDRVPAVIKNEMQANIQFVIHSRENASLVPIWLVHGRTNQNFKLLAEDRYGDIVEREIYLGRTDGKDVEILSPVAKNTVFFYQPPTSLRGLANASHSEEKE